jgi:hypothetical protein
MDGLKSDRKPEPCQVHQAWNGVTLGSVMTTPSSDQTIRRSDSDPPLRSNVESDEPVLAEHSGKMMALANAEQWAA